MNIIKDDKNKPNTAPINAKIKASKITFILIIYYNYYKKIEKKIIIDNYFFKNESF